MASEEEQVAFGFQPCGEASADAEVVAGQDVEPSASRIEIAYADHRDNRMIIVGAAAWETMAEQERRFEELPEVSDSDFIADFYDATGSITKDKCITAQTVETVLGVTIEEAIERGRQRENELSRAGRVARSKMVEVSQ